LNLRKNSRDYSTISSSYDEFREWASVLEDELAIKETSDGEPRQDVISGE